MTEFSKFKTGAIACVHPWWTSIRHLKWFQVFGRLIVLFRCMATHCVMTTMLILIGTAFCGCSDEKHDEKQTCSSPTTAPATRPSKEIFSSGLQYWANPSGILDREWYLVVAGTVLDVLEERGPEHRPVIFMGKMRVREVLYVHPKAAEVDSTKMKFFESDGFGGLKTGDKIIVFINPYDGSDGIVPVRGTNCNIGIKIDDWNGTVPKAVKAACRNPENLAEILKNDEYLEAWRCLDSAGVERILATNQQ